MPQLGETVTEGTITAWCKQVGDPIEVDEALFEVSTEKVDTEVPSAVPGFLRAILVPEGDTVPIGTPVAIVTATADEPFDADAGEPASVEAAVARVEEPAAVGAPAPAPTPPAEPPARRTARARPAGGSGAVLTPVVRRLLDEHGLTEDGVVGSGRDGRMTRADVLAAAAQRQVAPSNGHGARRPAASRRTGRPDRRRPRGAPRARARRRLGDDDEVLDLSRARLATAEHMMRSLATSAHALVATAVDYVDIDRVRREAGLSYLPVRGPGRRRGAPQPSAPQRQRRRRPADRAPRRPPRHRRRRGRRGAGGAGRARRRSAAAPRPRRGHRRRRGAHPTPTHHHRRAHRRHVHHHQRRRLGHARHGADHQPAPGRRSSRPTG